MTETTEKKNSGDRFDLLLDGKDYTVTITGDYREGEGEKNGTATPLIGVYDSRDGTPTFRQLPRMPDFRKTPSLLHDMLLDDTKLVDDEPVAGLEEPEAVTKAGDFVPVFRPGARVYDEDGNIYIVAYNTDSNDRYMPALVVEYLEPKFAAEIFLVFAKASTTAIKNLNSRCAESGLRIRNMSREFDKTKRTFVEQVTAQRNALESLDTCASHYKSKSELHERQAKVLYGSLVQFASPESWVGEQDGPANKLTSAVNGYDVAGLAMHDVTVDLLRQQILTESKVG